MKWLLLIAIYSGGHMTQFSNVKFATKEICEASGQWLTALYKPTVEEIKFICLENTTRKKGKKNETS